MFLRVHRETPVERQGKSTWFSKMSSAITFTRCPACGRVARRSRARCSSRRCGWREWTSRPSFCRGARTCRYRARMRPRHCDLASVHVLTAVQSWIRNRQTRSRVATRAGALDPRNPPGRFATAAVIWATAGGGDPHRVNKLERGSSRSCHRSLARTAHPTPSPPRTATTAERTICIAAAAITCFGNRR